jgi:glycosyltransferase involved in cell wall biosynthesis
MCDMDVLLLPNQDKLMVMGEDIGKFTSPLKLFEYMASGRAIVASDLPVIREVLDENSAYLADSSDEKMWLEAIKSIRKDPADAERRALKAKKEAEKYTWKSRAARMIGNAL